MFRPNLKFVALSVPEITAIEVFGWGFRTPNLGEEEAVGDGTARKRVGEFL